MKLGDKITDGARMGGIVDALYTDKGPIGRVLNRTPTWCDVRWSDGARTCRIPVPLPEGWGVVEG